jgi:hypothetical protein
MANVLDARMLTLRFSRDNSGTFILLNSASTLDLSSIIEENQKKFNKDCDEHRQGVLLQ